MTELTPPTVAGDLYRIHLVITRALDLAIERGGRFAGEGFPDTATRTGFLSYIQGALLLLHSHHTVEDETIFPYFQDKLPGSPFELMADQHRKLIPALSAVESALSRLSVDEDPAPALRDLVSALETTRELWTEHYKLEEEYLSEERIAGAIDAGEQLRLCHLFAEESRKHAPDEELLVPFVLYNLSPADRALMSQVFPPIVVERLVPIDWKERWEPMSPFLLL